MAISSVPIFAQSTVEDLYGVTYDKKLLRVDTASGRGTYLAALNVVGNPIGLAAVKSTFGEGAQMWLITTSNFLYRVNPWTGALLATNVLSPPRSSAGDLAAARLGPAFFVGTINTTGALALVSCCSTNSSGLGPLVPRMEGLELDVGGTLWGLSAGSSPSLYTIDQTNGATTLVGPLGINVPGAQYGDIAVGGSQASFLKYAAVGTLSESYLFAVGSTAAATLVGPVGFPGVTGLAFHVRRPGPLSVRRQGGNVVVSWPAENGGYLWSKTNVTSFGNWEFNTVFPVTNSMKVFYLSPFPPL